MDEALSCGGYMAFKFLIDFAAENRHAVRFSWSNAVDFHHNIVEYDMLYAAQWQVLTNYIAKASPQTYNNCMSLFVLSLLHITQRNIIACILKKLRPKLDDRVILWVNHPTGLIYPRRPVLKLL